MDNININDLGKRIRQAREKLNMSQFQLHEKTGISTTQISTYENGKKGVGIHVLAKIAPALGLSLDELYYGTADHRPISTATNVGELIVNCIFALYEQGVICSLCHVRENEFVGIGLEYTYKIGFDAFADVLNDLVLKLSDFDENQDNYPEPENFKKQLLAAAAKRINTEIKTQQK